MVAAGGSVGKRRLPVLRLIRRTDPSDHREAERHRRAGRQAGAGLPPAAVLVVDAGFGGADLLMGHVPRCVARGARNCTARRHRLPTYNGRGRRPAYGVRVRPWPRQHQGQTSAATPPDAPAQWVGAGRLLRAQVWATLVRATAQPGAAAVRGAVLDDPRSQTPLVVATTLPVSAYALCRHSADPC